MHAQLIIWPRTVPLCLSLHLHPVCVYASSVVLARLRVCTGSPELSLPAYAISTKVKKLHEQGLFYVQVYFYYATMRVYTMLLLSNASGFRVAISFYCPLPSILDRSVLKPIICYEWLRNDSIQGVKKETCPSTLYFFALLLLYLLN